MANPKPAAVVPPTKWQLVVTEAQVRLIAEAIDKVGVPAAAARDMADLYDAVQACLAHIGKAGDK